MFDSLDKKARRLLFNIAGGVTGILGGWLIISLLPLDPPVSQEMLRNRVVVFITVTLIGSLLIYIYDSVKERE